MMHDLSVCNYEVPVFVNNPQVTRIGNHSKMEKITFVFAILPKMACNINNPASLCSMSFMKLLSIRALPVAQPFMNEFPASNQALNALLKGSAIGHFRIAEIVLFNVHEI